MIPKGGVGLINKIEKELKAMTRFLGKDCKFRFFYCQKDGEVISSLYLDEFTQGEFINLYNQEVPEIANLMRSVAQMNEQNPEIDFGFHVVFDKKNFQTIRFKTISLNSLKTLSLWKYKILGIEESVINHLNDNELSELGTYSLELFNLNSMSTEIALLRQKRDRKEALLEKVLFNIYEALLSNGYQIDFKTFVLLTNDFAGTVVDFLDDEKANENIIQFQFFADDMTEVMDYFLMNNEKIEQLPDPYDFWQFGMNLKKVIYGEETRNVGFYAKVSLEAAEINFVETDKLKIYQFCNLWNLNFIGVYKEVYRHFTVEELENLNNVSKEVFQKSIPEEMINEMINKRKKVGREHNKYSKFFSIFKR